MRPRALLVTLTVLLAALLFGFAAGPAAAAPPPPTVTSLSFDFGGTPGGTWVVIKGSAFTGATSVTFGGVKAASFHVDSDTQITASSPAHSAGLVDVIVTTPYGSSPGAGSGNDFTYVPRTEQSNSGLLFDGAWTLASTTSASGGSYRYTSTAGDSMTIAFYGDRFTYIGKLGPDQGLVGVYVDGDAPVNVDLYTPVTYYKRFIFSFHMSPRYHTVTLKCTGLRNISSSGLRVNVDAFDIDGILLGCSRVQQTSSSIVYGSAWSTFTTSSASGGSYKRSSDPNASVIIPFQGTKLDIFGMKGVTGGLVDVYVDDTETPWQTIDLNAASAQYHQKLFSISDTDLNVHFVILKPNKDNPTGKFINLDYVELAGSLLAPMRFEQTASAFFTWAGSWSTLSTSSASGGSLAYTNTTGSSVTVEFSGVHLDLIAKTGPNYGIAKLTLDGAKVSMLDLYSAAAGYKKTVWSTGWIGPGEHTLKIEWTGTKRAAATKANINLDAILLIGPV